MYNDIYVSEYTMGKILFKSIFTRKVSMFNKKRQLEMALQDIPPHQNPKINLEQYSTPSVIAADVLWNAYSIGDIEGMKS